MAYLYPTFEIINNYKVKPTEGELKLITFLVENLDDTYEIYFQPYLNGDRPDVVLMRKNTGVMIFEVKDWKITNYYIDEHLNWRLKENNAYILPPYKQVMNYKNNLYDLHIEELFELKKKDIKSFNIVSCSLYFHAAEEKEVIEFHKKNVDPKKHYNYLNNLNYISILGRDTLTKEKLNRILSKHNLHKDSKYFPDELYFSFKRYLQPPYHSLEDGIPINYTPEQLELSRSEIRPRRKVKGIAGGGKTLVLAKRSVNAHIRTDDRVLIITFNLSLVNYIHDKINEVRENFAWSNFEIINYHQFFISKANEYNLKIDNLNNFEDSRFFESVKSKIVKYNVILIDEVQDYQTEWLQLIHDYFLNEDGEFCVFGDEKQNIYLRLLDENKEPRTVGITGRFNKTLNRSFRFTPKITDLAKNFQTYFFQNRYDSDDISKETQGQIDFTSKIEYYSYDLFDAKSIRDKVFDILKRDNIHSSDIGILSSKIENIRDLDYTIRTEKHEKTKCMFESKEEYDELINKHTKQDESGNKTINMKQLETDLEHIRRKNKIHFWMKTGTIKLSTIHSFKGWEIHTLFLLIDYVSGTDQDSTMDELIYTAITRCRYNLFVLNMGNSRYHDFFVNNI